MKTNSDQIIHLNPISAPSYTIDHNYYDLCGDVIPTRRHTLCTVPGRAYFQNELDWIATPPLETFFLLRVSTTLLSNICLDGIDEFGCLYQVLFRALEISASVAPWGQWRRPTMLSCIAGRTLEHAFEKISAKPHPPSPPRKEMQLNVVVDSLLYVHRNRRLIRDGSPGRPSRLSHSS